MTASARPGAVVVGASAGVGRALAACLARRGYDLVVAARDERDLRAVADDLHLRHGVRVVPLAVDLTGGDDALEVWFDRCRTSLERIDAVAVTAGAVDDADDGMQEWDALDALVRANFVSVVKLASRFVALFEERRHGTVVLVSSIAAAAPRRRNVVYSAAKAALESYARSMQHRLAGSGVHVGVYVLGYVDTAMSRGRSLALPVADPARIAESIADDLNRPRRFAHLPRWWRPVTFLLGLLPWPIYRRLSF